MTWIPGQDEAVMRCRDGTHWYPLKPETVDCQCGQTTREARGDRFVITARFGVEPNRTISVFREVYGGAPMVRVILPETQADLTLEEARALLRDLAVAVEPKSTSP